MDKKILKNIDLSTVLNLKDLVDYQPGQIVSKTLVQNKSVSMTEAAEKVPLANLA